MDELRKALDTIALGYSQGNCSVDTLIKACNNYKAKKGLVDDFDYEIMVAKSCIDSINGVEQDAEIAKAIVPGQTKVVDGVLYVYSATKKGSKTQYDWHVVRRGAKTQAEIGRGAKLSEASIKGKQKYINDLFPNDLNSLKVVKTLGGSTGAKLVEDGDGNQYVLKKGSNTNSDHVKSEYLANQLYGILGLRTPDYELYDDNSEAILLSRFIPGTHVPNSTDFKKMSDGFMADVLLANWDVYQNDNCLINNATGAVIRVDNGGCLNYRAQGAQKTFDGNTYDTWKSMLRYNPGIANQLSYDDQLKQIDDILKKRDDVVNFLKESGQETLAAILDKRFDGFTQVKAEIQKTVANNSQKQAAKLGQIQPRNLKPDDEMYAEFDEAKINELLDETSKQTGDAVDSQGILTSQYKNGWALLANICKARGYDARPEVLSEKDFWKERQATEWPMMFRGFDSVGHLDDFKFSDFCHFGQYGIWGQGIYAHSDDSSKMGGSKKHSNSLVDNHSTESNWKQSKVYSGGFESAMDYARNNADRVAKMFWKSGAKIVNSEDLLDEIKAIGAADANSPQAQKLKKELDDIKAEWTKNELDLMNIRDVVKKDVYKKLHYDEEAVAALSDYLSNINWNSRNAQGKRNYPMFNEAVLKHIKTTVEKCGGTAKVLNADEEDEQVHFEIGGRDLYISKYSWNNNAIKQKNQFAPPYHYQAEKFKVFFDTNCVRPAAEAVERKMLTGKKAKELKDKVAKNKQDYYAKEKEYNDAILLNNNPTAKGTDIYSRIYNTVKDCNYASSGNHGKSVIGIYAALKGYDGIYQPDGNNSGHGFMIILNRSKIVTSID